MASFVLVQSPAASDTEVSGNDSGDLELISVSSSHASDPSIKPSSPVGIGNALSIQEASRPDGIGLGGAEGSSGSEMPYRSDPDDRPTSGSVSPRVRAVVVCRSTSKVPM
jgi:hypothetical protein